MRCLCLLKASVTSFFTCSDLQDSLLHTTTMISEFLSARVISPEKLPEVMSLKAIQHLIPLFSR